MISTIQEIAVKLNLITSKDLECYTTTELLYLVIKKLNEVITVVNQFSTDIIESTIVSQLNQWLEDGTLADVINEEVFSNLSKAIDGLKELNVKTQYGAVGDGTTDDTQAFINAMTVIETIGGGTLHVPKGIYSVGYFLLRENTHLKLDPEAILKAQTTVIASNFLAEETTITRYNGRSNIVIDGGGTIDANGYSVSSGTPIQFGHCHDIVVRDIRFINTVDDHSIEFVGVNRALVDNCRFEGYVNKSGSSKAYKEAIQIDYCGTDHGGGGVQDNTPSKNITVRKCYFGGLDDYYGVFNTAVGSHGEGIIPEYMDNICIEDCIVDGCHNGAFTPFCWSNSRIHHNVIKNSEGFGFLIRNCKELDISHNDIDVCIDGLGVYGSDTVEINRNHIKNCQKHGIHATEGSSNILISNNYLLNQNLIYQTNPDDSTYSGIAVASDSNTSYTNKTVIINNTVDSENGETAYGIDIRNKAKNTVVSNNNLLAKFKNKPSQNREESTIYHSHRFTLYNGTAYNTETDYLFSSDYQLSDFDEYEITFTGNGIECRTFLATESYPKIRTFNLTDSISTFAINFYETNIEMNQDRFKLTHNTHQYIDTTTDTNTKTSTTDGSGIQILKIVGIKYDSQIQR